MTQDRNSTSPTPPDDPRSNIAAYSIGATDYDEAVEVERLLAADPALRREAAEYAAAGTMLNFTVPRVEPPAALKGKIMAAARASRPPVLTVLPKAAAPVKRETRLRDVIAFAASTAAVLLLGVSLYLVSQTNTLREREAAMATTVAVLTQEQLEREARALETGGQMEMAVALLMAEDGQRMELKADDGTMKAMVVFAPGHSEALMITHDLPSLSEEHSYQLWQIGPDGEMVSAGVFNTNPNGMLAMIFEPPLSWHSANGVGISVEPPGGSEVPTTEPVAIALME